MRLCRFKRHQIKDFSPFSKFMENESDTKIKFTALIFLISGSLARNEDEAVQSPPAIKKNK